MSKIIFEHQPFPFAAAVGCYWHLVSDPSQGSSRAHSTGPHYIRTSGTVGKKQWIILYILPKTSSVLFWFLLNPHSSDRGCSAPSASGSSPFLSPAPSAVAPGWLAARQCVYADGSYPGGSQCTLTAGCLDYAEPGKRWQGKETDVLYNV